jgi:hypothetical protein
MFELEVFLFGINSTILRMSFAFYTERKNEIVDNHTIESILEN